MADDRTLDTEARRGPAEVAYSADRVFDGERVHGDAAVVIDAGRVARIVPAADLAPGVRLHRHRGCTILPGLVDAHVHLTSWQGPLYLSAGVTTVRDVGNDLRWVLAARGRATALPWPRIRCAGPLVEGPRRIWSFGIPSPDVESCAAVCGRLAEAGVDAVKLYASIPEAWVRPLVERVHGRGKRAIMHCQGTPALAAAAAGVDELFHLDGLLPSLWPERPAGWLELWGHPGFAAKGAAREEAADLLARSAASVTPTLAYWDSRVADVRRSQEDERRSLPEEVRRWQDEAFPPRPGVDETWLRARDQAMAFVGMLHGRGVPVGAGTDAPFEGMLPGLCLWRELALLAEAGLGALGALRAATSVASVLLDAPEIGHLSPGSTGDLVVVGGDPTAAIPARPDVRLVLRGGETFDPSRLAVDLADAARCGAEPIGAALAEYARASRARRGA